MTCDNPAGSREPRSDRLELGSASERLGRAARLVGATGVALVERSGSELAVVASWGLGDDDRAKLEASAGAILRVLTSEVPLIRREGEGAGLAAVRIGKDTAAWAVFDPPRRLTGQTLSVLGELASAANGAIAAEVRREPDGGPASPGVALADTLGELMLSDDSTVGTYVIQDGRFREVNQPLARLLGYRRPDLIGRAVAEIAHPLDRDLIRARMRGRLEGTADRSVYSFRAVTSTGQVVYLEVHGTRLELDGGPALGGIAVDVSERVRAQQAMRASERRFAEIVALSRDATICVDDEDAVVLFNPAAEAFFGVSAAEAIGRPVVALMPELADGSTPATAPEGEGARLVEGERPDGTPFAAEIWSTDSAGADRDLRVILVRDVTTQHRREAERERLLELERDQRRAAEGAQTRAQFIAEVTQALSGAFGEPDRILSLLPELAVPRTADYAICYRLGEEGPEPVAFSATDAVVRDALDSAPPALPTLSWATRPEGWAWSEAGEGPLEGRPTFRTHARRFYCRHLELFPIGDAGAVLALGRHRVPGTSPGGEPGLGRELASRASTALANAGLYQQARAATQLREQVLAVVSHDLRSPLEIIALTSDSLLRHWPPGPAEGELTRSQLELVQRSAQRMTRLVRDLLEVAQIEKGVLAVDPVPCDPGELLREAHLAHQPVAEEKQIRLVLESCEGSPPVEADPERVLQVLGNLLDNAFRHGPPDSEVRIRCVHETSSVRIEVADEGPGIPPEDRASIFEHFSRGQGRSWGLAGLGLAIARGIVEAHGGELDVESTPGEGATFYFTLPCSEPRCVDSEPEYQLQYG